MRSSAAAAAKRSRSLRVARVDAKLASGLRIDEPQLADVGELLLARIADLDGEHGVPAGEPQQRRPPVERAAEVGDDDDERPLRASPSTSSSASAERAVARRRLAHAAGERPQ